MRKLFLLLLLLHTLFGAKGQIVNIPDPAFKNALLNHIPVIDLNHDGQIQVSEAISFTGSMNVQLKNITDMTGLETFVNMQFLDCSYNLITILPLNNLGRLKKVICSFNSIHTLTLNNLTALQEFTCMYTQLATLSIMNTPSLANINCSQNKLTSLIISNAPAVADLDCSVNELTTFTMTPVAGFIQIDCSGNRLTALPLSNTPKLYVLKCSQNPLVSLPLSNLPELQHLECSNNLLTSLSLADPSRMKYLYCSNNQLTSLPSGMTGLQALFCDHNLLTSIPSPMNQLVELDISHNQISSISIDNCNNLWGLYFSHNLFTSFSLSNKPLLTEIICDSNLLTTFTISNMTSLNEINCSSNKITSLALNNFPSLKTIRAQYNLCSSLQLSALPVLEGLFIDHNSLPTLTLSGFPNLYGLQLNNNLLSSLNLINLPSLHGFLCDSNRLTELDCSNVPVLSAYCTGNPDLAYINVKNNTSGSSTILDVRGLTKLQAVCVDEVEKAYVQNSINSQLPGQSVTVSSFCNFTPTGGYNVVEGTIRFDKDANGCNMLDSTMQLVKVNLRDGNQPRTAFTNTSGVYKFYAPVNPDTLTTGLPSNWFTSIPDTQFVSFSGFGNTSVNDFCIRPIGSHHDLDIGLFPLSQARPGFNATYLLSFSNKGCLPESGTVTLSYDPSKLSFISSVPAVTNQSPGILTWNYNNLSPYASTNITVVMKLAPPPANNNGDILFFTATVNPVAGDETPGDNVFNLQQVVVGSLDPNDKEVLEGEKISIGRLDEFLHYLVRFQNTGTASAISVIIKDSLSENLDWSTFSPVAFSHQPGITLTKGMAEFVFDGINLPPANANEPASHGFIAFKIKPKRSLKPGDVISNKAAIYFDYNQAIITNTVNTTVYTPVYTDPSGLLLYSNPAKGYITFRVKDGVQIKEYALFNSAGQQFYPISVFNAAGFRKLDVTALPGGVYFLRILTDAGLSQQKVVVVK